MFWTCQAVFKLEPCMFKYGLSVSKLGLPLFNFEHLCFNFYCLRLMLDYHCLNFHQCLCFFSSCCTHCIHMCMAEFLACITVHGIYYMSHFILLIPTEMAARPMSILLEELNWSLVKLSTLQNFRTKNNIPDICYKSHRKWEFHRWKVSKNL